MSFAERVIPSSEIEFKVLRRRTATFSVPIRSKSGLFLSVFSIS